MYGLQVASSVLVALPGVNECLPEPIPAYAVVTNALMGIDIRAKRGSRLFSTQSPLLSDLALDAGVRQLQHYRLLTYPLVHLSLPHVVWDAWALAYANCSAANVAWLGTYFGGLAHYVASPVSRAAGTTAAAAALVGVRYVREKRHNVTRVKRMALGRLVVLALGGSFFGASPVALVFGGFFGGCLVAALIEPGPVKEDGYLLRRDARDAELGRKVRVNAPRRKGAARDPPVMSFNIVLLFALLMPYFLNAFIQLPQAAWLSITSPGSLSGRILMPPPRTRPWWRPF